MAKSSKRVIPPSQQNFYDNFHFAPAVIDVNRAPPRTRTGALRSIVPPSPSCPNALRPQQYASPSAVNAQT